MKSGVMDGWNDGITVEQMSNGAEGRLMRELT